MSKTATGLAFVLGAGILLGSLAQADPAGTDKKVADLIEKLGSGEFEDRETATVQLDKLGLDALESLRKASRSEDAEVRRRAEELVVKIEKREASTLILKPTRVTLSLKDVSVQEAIDALAKQTGFPVRLLDPEGKLKTNRVTLEVKDAPFWEVVDALSEKAGLVDAQVGAVPPNGVGPGLPPLRVRPPIRIRPPIRAVPLPERVDPVPLPPDAPPAPAVPPRPEGFAFVPPEKLPVENLAPQEVQLPDPVPVQVVPGVQIQVQQIQIGGGGQIIIGGGGMPFPGGMPQVQEGLVLTPGKFEKRAADVATSFRVRPTANQFQIQVPGQKVYMTTLEVTPEPRFRVVGQDKVEITRAIDDQDQKLNRIDPNQPQNLPGGGQGVGIAFPVGGLPAVPGTASLAVPLHFVQGEKPAKSLKELTGTISARIELPHSKAILVEKLLEAAGKTFKGEKGGEVKIHSIQKTNDLLAIRFEVAYAKDAVGATNGPEGIFFPGGGIQIAPGVAPAILPIAPPRAAPVPPQGRKQIEKPGFAFQAQAKPLPAPPAQPLPAIALAPVQIGVAGMAVGGGNLPTGLRILDEKGNPVVIAGVQQQWQAGPNGPAQVTWIIQIAQGKDQAKVEKMTFQQYKAATVDIPFTLKNVPMN